jgi:hypothetical protein
MQISVHIQKNYMKFGVNIEFQSQPTGPGVWGSFPSAITAADYTWYTDDILSLIMQSSFCLNGCPGSYEVQVPLM